MGTTAINMFALLIVLLCILVLSCFMLYVSNKMNKRKLVECNESIRRLEFSLDEKYRIIEAQNHEICRLNRELKDAKLITTIEDLNKAQDEQRTLL